MYEVNKNFSWINAFLKIVESLFLKYKKKKYKFIAIKIYVQVYCQIFWVELRVLQDQCMSLYCRWCFITAFALIYHVKKLEYKWTNKFFQIRFQTKYKFFYINPTLSGLFRGSFFFVGWGGGVKLTPPPPPRLKLVRIMLYARNLTFGT